MNQFRVQVAADGQMVLPDRLRERLRIQNGGQLTVREDQGRLVLEASDDVVAQAQAIVKRYAPAASNVVQELMDERRAEAAGG